jgi:hypothetical protein
MEEIEALSVISNSRIVSLFRVGNTHIGDLKEVTVNIFGPNKSESSMKEYCM